MRNPARWILVLSLLLATGARSALADKPPDPPPPPPPPPSVPQNALLRLSWDRCAYDGLVADKSFACDTNTGSDVLYASVLFQDRVTRANVQFVNALVDVTTTTSPIPPWWQVRSGSCRSNAVLVEYGPFPEAGSCAPWFASAWPDGPLGVFAIQENLEGPETTRLNIAAGVPIGYEATLAAGQELLLFRIVVSHARSAGTGACQGCLVPTCIGFGHLELSYNPAAPDEIFLGDAASAVTWQGAYVSGFQPTRYPQTGYYVANLECATGPVPARGRTWGLIKTLYR